MFGFFWGLSTMSLNYHNVLIIYIYAFLGALIVFADHFAFNDRRGFLSLSFFDCAATEH